jgi:glutamine---fructose-6-phosphate transaminase (isomerizing)
MAFRGHHTLQEILSQPASWASALDAVRGRTAHIQALLCRFAGHPLLLSGCGSPYYLSLSAAAMMRAHARRPCLAAPASELLFHPATVIADGAAPLLIVFSRSGETSEAIAVARAVQRRGGAVLAVGCDTTTTLMRLADVSVEVAAGREQSVVQTRSFAGMFVAAQSIVALAAERQLDGEDALAAGLTRLPEIGPAYIERIYAAVAESGAAIASLIGDPAITRVFVLGSGTCYGLACEAALKFKEMSLTDAEPFHTLEFRHGPMSLADEHALVIGLVGEAAAAEELAVLRDIRRFGARTVALMERIPTNTHSLDAVLAFDSFLPEPARPLLYLAPLQLMAYKRTVAKGLDPDTPRNLVRFVRLDTLEDGDS